jgi:hypothetical protein
MSKLLKQIQPSSLKLIKVVPDGSAKTFIYENPDKKDKSSFIAKLKTKIQLKLNPPSC